MTRTFLVATTVLLTSFTAFDVSAQFKEKVERNIRLLEMIDGCTEGFARAVEGSSLVYSSFRPDPQMALITRATTGAMTIMWNTQPVPTSLPDHEVNIVVMAGMYGQEPSGFTFHMFVNGVLRFDFTTTPEDTWNRKGREGGVLRFFGVVRDKYGDVFGCLRITMPESWVERGKTVQMEIVGEKANHPAWFMVFEAPDVIAYQRESVRNESYCDMAVTPTGSGFAIAFQGPSSWQGKEVGLTSGRGTTDTGRFARRGGSSWAEFTLHSREITTPLTVSIDHRLLMRVDSLFTAVHTTLVYPLKLVSISAPLPGPEGWHLMYESAYHPGLGTSLQELSDTSAGQGTGHLIVSTHQDIAWMDSPENCIRDRDEKIITPLLNIMKSDPAYHFDLEDVLCLREYLGRHPDRKEETHRLMAEGRLGVGASFNEPYEDLCSGEMLVREFCAGRRWLRSEFPGCDTKTYWNPDVPARTLQMAQVMRKAGVEYLVMSRFEKGLYSWFSPDGSSILAFSPGHYGDFKSRVEGTSFEQAAGYIAAAANEWQKATHLVSRDIPLVSMSDMSGPDKYDTLITKWTSLQSIGNVDGSLAPLSLPPLRYSLMQQYLNRVPSSHAVLPVVRGERPNIWLYIHGPTHHWAISAKREADFLLPAAEIFNTVESLLNKSFASYPQTELTSAWEAQLYPDHGWGGKNGNITDSTFRVKYESARGIAKILLCRSLTSIASRIKTTSRSGSPLFVFNSLSWKRSGPVQAVVNLRVGAAKKGIDLYDASGKGIPVQVEINQRHPDGSIASAELLFVAHDVPPVGYVTYYVRPSRSTHTPRAESRTIFSLENAFYRLVLGQGGVSQIVDKELDVNLLDTGKLAGGELFTMQSIGEDAGEWDEPQQPTMEGFDKLGNHPAAWQRVESGRVRDVAEARYALAHATVVQRVILYHDLKRVDFEISLLSWDGTPYREFRLAFPVHVQGEVAYEVPFGVLEVGKGEMKGSPGERYKQEAARIHPRGIQNWIGLYGQHVGVTISSSVSVWDYEDPTGSAADRLLLQPVLLASRRSCHSEGPWYLQKGDHHYRFSLTSHAPGWQNGQRQGVEANAPLFVVCDPPKNPQAHLSESGSFVSLDADNLVLSTMKKCEDDSTVVVRLYENAGRSTSGQLHFYTPVAKAEETNLLEESSATISSNGKEVALQVGHNEIQTIRITPTR